MGYMREHFTQLNGYSKNNVCWRSNCSRTSKFSRVLILIILGIRLWHCYINAKYVIQFCRAVVFKSVWACVWRWSWRM